jgi:formylglycine-generating enzyme required for sulfatase activity
MSGNVWEWTSTREQPYPYAADDGRENEGGNSTDVLRVTRGGAWSGDAFPFYLRAAIRGRAYSDFRYFNLGFRCARDDSGAAG